MSAQLQDGLSAFVSTAGTVRHCHVCYGVNFRDEPGEVICLDCGARLEEGPAEAVEFAGPLGKGAARQRVDRKAAKGSIPDRVHVGPAASDLVQEYCLRLQTVLMAGVSRNLTSAARQLWFGTVASSGILTDSFAAGVDELMEIEEDRTADRDFVMRQIQLRFFQALSQQIVLVIIYVAALWLQDGLTSHDLLFSCVNGTLGYFRSFHLAAQVAESRFSGFSVYGLLSPRGLPGADDLESQAFRLCRKLRLTLPEQNADLIMQGMLVRAGLPQMAHAGANLFHSILALGKGKPEKPSMSFRRPATCVAASGSWLLQSKDHPHQQLRAPEQLKHVVDWGWEAAGHTCLLSPDASLLDQVGGEAVSTLLHELDRLASDHGFGQLTAKKELQEFLPVFTAIAQQATVSGGNELPEDLLPNAAVPDEPMRDAPEAEQIHHSAAADHDMTAARPANGQTWHLQPGKLQDAMSVLLMHLIGKSAGVGLNQMTHQLVQFHKHLVAASAGLESLLETTQAGQTENENDAP